MKKLLLVSFLAIVSATPALAQGGHGWGHHGGWGWRGDWIFPALITSAILYDVTRPPLYVQPVPVYAPTYVQSAAPEAAAAPATGDWYFCAGANAYYPYVRSCPGGWQAVPATPPGQVAR